ncbi:integral membrane sensor signal transduction histidine kinase [Calothrix sp. NIES-4071]|nr:integral membrane sensor signal transduction histidine kinase [Calothrix sp. NIES-4071]BAZ55916.1 integral membrane sensor signal transduction histidine kinase [Calothrix sp. NIES-4105]
MPKPRPLSFRRLLFSRILLLSIPVLLTGELIVFRKARQTQLEIAQQNLTESATLKGGKMADTITSLKSNLLTATQVNIVRSGDSAAVQQFINEFEERLSNQVECVQFSDIENNKVLASTCGDEPLADIKAADKSDIKAKIVIPPKVYVKSIKNYERGTQNKLQLVLSAPVPDDAGTIRYTLTIQSELQQKVRNKPGLLTGSTVVISEDGTILAHPIEERVGTNIAQHPDATRLKQIVQNALSGKENRLQFFKEKQGEELLAGYIAINSPISTQNQKWVILDVTTLDNALYGLTEIKFILIILTMGLVGACLIASLYLARYLARPVEKLCDYALNINSSSHFSRVPRFQIREFNQLSQAIDQMVERLKSWGEELEIAWKDSKTANQVKSQFLATTSHELRNPLNIIINCIRVVREDLCDSREEELEFLKRADDTAIHLLEIINDLLDISKIEAGKLSVSLEKIDLRDILKEVINLQSLNIQQKGLQLNIPELENSIPVNADPIKLKQVLMNIISNATKFTEEGSITILVENIAKDELTNTKLHVSISIRDTGIGIELEQQHKLFRPFVMVEGTNNRKFGGTGLGLAISRNLIEMMGGTISLESAGINKGTTIKITLPLIEETDTELENITSTALSEVPTLKRLVSQSSLSEEINAIQPIEKSSFKILNRKLKTNHNQKTKSK